MTKGNIDDWCDAVDELEMAVLWAARDTARAGSYAHTKQWVELLKELEGMGLK